MNNSVNSKYKYGTDMTLEIMKKKLEVLKRIRFLQKSLIKISFNDSDDRSSVYVSLLNSLKFENQSLYKINQQAREKRYGQ